MEPEEDPREGHGEDERRTGSHCPHTDTIASTSRSVHERDSRGDAKPGVGNVSAGEGTASGGMLQKAPGALAVDDELQSLHEQQPNREQDQHPAHIHQRNAPPEGNHRADSDQRGGEEGCRPGEPDREGTRLVAAKAIEERGDVCILPFQVSKVRRQEEEAQEPEQAESLRYRGACAQGKWTLAEALSCEGCQMGSGSSSV